MASDIEIESWNIEANTIITTLFISRQMGKTKDWLNGKRRRNNQAPIFWWLVHADLLPLLIVKVSHGDGLQLTSPVVEESGQLVAAVQLQLLDSGVGILLSCFSSGRPLVVLVCAIPGGREGTHLALIRWIHKPRVPSSICIESMRPYSSMRARSVHSSLSMNTPGLIKYNWRIASF